MGTTDDLAARVEAFREGLRGLPVTVTDHAHGLVNDLWAEVQRLDRTCVVVSGAGGTGGVSPEPFAEVQLRDATVISPAEPQAEASSSEVPSSEPSADAASHAD